MSRRAELSHAANQRYVAALKTVSVSTPLSDLTTPLSQPIKDARGRRHRDLNLLAPDDARLPAVDLARRLAADRLPQPPQFLVRRVRGRRRSPPPIGRDQSQTAAAPSPRPDSQTEVRSSLPAHETGSRSHHRTPIRTSRQLNHHPQ